MSKAATQTGMITFDCVCGEGIELDPHRLGTGMVCRSCKRYLRPSLRFLLVDRDKAPNLTVQCGCGHFVVQPANAVGKKARCEVCHRNLIMPQPVVKFGSPGVVRVPRKVLENQLRKAQTRKKRASKEMTRLESAGHAGRITLRPGESICVNLSCGALLAPSANVCPKCGTNRRTNRLYVGPGPDGDPTPKWKAP